MKKSEFVIIILMSIFLILIGFPLLILPNPHIISTEEKIKELNKIISDFKYSPDKVSIYTQNLPQNIASRISIKPNESVEITRMVDELINSIKVIDIEDDVINTRITHCSIIRICWTDITICVDLELPTTENTVYINWKSNFYKAKANINSINELKKFVDNKNSE